MLADADQSLITKGGTSMDEHELEQVMEKRRDRRIRSLNLTSYTPRKGEEQEHIISIGRTLDVSVGGAKVETHRELSTGTELDMDIAIEDRLISAKGVVVRVEQLKSGLFGTGIRFTSISEADRELLK
jgi:c-di-GMP-binding flagellar brake protein YcgR